MAEPWDPYEFAHQVSLTDSDVYTDGGDRSINADDLAVLGAGSRRVRGHEDYLDTDDDEDSFEERRRDFTQFEVPAGARVVPSPQPVEDDHQDEEIVQNDSLPRRACAWILSHRIWTLAILAIGVIAVVVGVVLVTTGNNGNGSNLSVGTPGEAVSGSSPDDDSVPAPITPAPITPRPSFRPSKAGETFGPTVTPSPTLTAPSPGPSNEPTTAAPFTQAPSPVPSIGTAFPSITPSTAAPSQAVSIMSKIQLVSDPAALADPTSPQARAVDWILNTDQTGLTANSPNLYQRYALATLYFGLDGSNWDTPWDADTATENECTWFGIDCNADDQVTNIDLRQNSLSGSLPPEIRLLVALKDVDIQNNLIQGPLPSEMGELGNLESLSFHYNQLTAIPTELGALPKIQRLTFDDNEIGGEIPSELGLLSNTLELISLDDNNMVGSFPTELYLLASLKTLRLDRNNFTGPLSTLIGGLVSLTNLSIHSNDLTGPIPTELAFLSNLEDLQIQLNDLTGTIPSELCELGMRRLRANCLPEGSTGVELVSCSCCTRCCSNEPESCEDY